MIEQELFSHLSTDVALTALIDARIFPLVVPQNQAFPAIVYTVITDNDRQSLQGQNSYSKARIQIDCYAKGYLQVKELKDVVKSALYSFAYHPHQLSTRDLSSGEENLWRISIDFKINY